MTAVTKANTRTCKEWTEAIAAQWQKANQTAEAAVEEALETGRMLEQARGELTTDEYWRVVANSGVGKRKAGYLRDIAKSAVGKKVTTSSFLPRKWSTLNELTHLDDADLADAEARGLIDTDTTARGARIIAESYKTPTDAVLGEGRRGAMLPPPTEANRIARATGRGVAASDGHIYLGATDAEAADATRKRQRTFKVIDAIGVLASVNMTPEAWVREAEEWRIKDLTLGNIEAAIKWLEDVREPLRQKMKVVENGK